MDISCSQITNLSLPPPLPPLTHSPWSGLSELSVRKPATSFAALMDELESPSVELFEFSIVNSNMTLFVFCLFLSRLELKV